MKSIFRVFTGNYSPIWSDVPPSREVQLDSGAYPVRLSGPAGKNSEDSGSGLFPRRYFFLLRGSISYCDTKGVWLSKPALQETVENQRQNRHTMFLGPNVTIRRDKAIIYLSRESSSETNLQFNGVPLRKSVWEIEFDSEADAKEWEEAINIELTTSYLTNVVYNAVNTEWRRSLDELIWLRIFQGNASLFYLYVSLTENTANGTDPTNRTDDRSGAVIFDRLFNFTKKITPSRSRLDESFAFVLDKASSFDVVDRVLLLMFDVKQEVLTRGSCGDSDTADESDNGHVEDSPSRWVGLRRPARPATFQDSDVGRFFVDFLKVFKAPPKTSGSLTVRHRQRQALLRVFHHPGDWRTPESPPSEPRAPNDRSVRTVADRPVVNWFKEIAWYKTICTETDRRVVVDLSNVLLLLISPLCFLYVAMERLCISKHTSGAEQDFEAIRDIFVNILLPEDLGVTFKAPVSGLSIDARHFVRLLLSADLNKHERTKIVVDMIPTGRMNNNVFRMILAEGLVTQSYETMLQLVSATLFGSGSFANQDFTPDSVMRIYEFPMIIVEELWEALGNNALTPGDFRPLLMSFALRAEACPSHKGVEVTTLSTWVENAGKKEGRKKINGLLEDFQIARYLRDKSSPLLSQKAAASNMAAPSHSPFNHNIPLVYSKEPLEDFILGLIIVCVTTKSGEFIAFVNSFPDYFEKFFHKDHPLREKAIDHISAKYGLRPEVREKMKNGHIMNEGRHFHADALELMTLRSTGISDSIVSGLIVMALKFHDYENMKSRVEAVISGLKVAVDAKEPMMREIIRSIEGKKAAELTTVSIEDMMSCVNNAVTALALLKNMNNDNEQNRLRALFAHYLKNEQVAAWPGLFKSAHSIAMFIKYMSREDIDKAYALFAERNADNADFLALLNQVQHIHSVPVVSDVEMNKIVTEGTSPEVVETLLNSIRERCARSMDPNKQFISEASVAWMRLMFAKVTIPMAPKNTQIITMAACACWLADRPPGFGALIAKVGTGEGKSLIIAMLAAYCVKVLKKKVHILENNVGLLDKDYSTFCSSVNKNNISTQSFYEALNVTASKNLNEHADVTYCQRADMETFYRDGVFAGKQPFKNTVLIVDEVDELIVDKDPNTSYVKDVTDSSGPLKVMFDILRESRGTGQPPVGHSPQMWAEAREAYAQAMQKKKDKHYKVYKGTEVFMVTNGEVEKNLYALWLEYVRYQVNPSYRPNVKSYFFYQNITHLMTQYDAIVGLSGSLGCPSEREFLRDTYKASCFEVPSFLDTCKGVHKHAPVLISGFVEVHADEASHTEAVIRVALAKYSTVPVLIVTKSSDAARALAVKILSRLQSPQYNRTHGGFEASDFLQLFLKLDDNGQNMPWLNIIEKATDVVSPTLPRRITVTDAFGGRGHDFLVNDEDANDKGGLAMIATLMPESERDWTQWLGRTARNDRTGQYAVILRADEGPINSKEELLRQHHATGTQYRPTIIGKLLELRDAQSQVKIDDMKERVRSGQRLNELCDHHYAQYNRDATGEWPGVPENEQLSLFLGKSNSHTKDGIRTFAASMGLHYTSKYDN